MFAFPVICCSWSAVPLVFIGVLALLFIQTTQVEAFAALSILWDSIAIPADLFSQLVQIMWDTFILPVLLIYNSIMDIFIRIVIILLDTFIGLFPSPYAPAPVIMRAVASGYDPSLWTSHLIDHQFHSPLTSKLYGEIGTHAALAASLPAPSVLVGGKYFVLIPPALFDLVVGNILDAIAMVTELVSTVVGIILDIGATAIHTVVDGFMLLIDAITSGEIVPLVQYALDAIAGAFTDVWTALWSVFSTVVPAGAQINGLLNLLMGVGAGALSQLPFVIGCITNPSGCGALVSMVIDVVTSVATDICNDIASGWL